MFREKYLQYFFQVEKISLDPAKRRERNPTKTTPSSVVKPVAKVAAVSSPVTNGADNNHVINNENTPRGKGAEVHVSSISSQLNTSQTELWRNADLENPEHIKNSGCSFPSIQFVLPM